MKTIKKRISELPKPDYETINQALYVKDHLDELIMNAVKHDNNEDLREELRYDHQRFDMYMANKIRLCNTALCVCYRPTDEYYVITKSNRCYNISRLIKKKKIISISQWIHKMSFEIFDQWSITPEDTVLKLKKNTGLETIIEVKNEALSIVNKNHPNSIFAKRGILNEGNSGDFEPFPPQCDLDMSLRINELHIFATLLFNILSKYPIDFTCFQDFKYPLGICVLIDVDFNDSWDVFIMYQSYRSKNKSPFEAMELIETKINKEMISSLNECESLEYKLWE